MTDPRQTARSIILAHRESHGGNEPSTVALILDDGSEALILAMHMNRDGYGCIYYGDESDHTTRELWAYDERNMLDVVDAISAARWDRVVRVLPNEEWDPTPGQKINS